MQYCCQVDVFLIAKPYLRCGPIYRTIIISISLQTAQLSELHGANLRFIATHNNYER